MSKTSIVHYIEAAKSHLMETFNKHPEDFFSENDITAFFLGRINHELTQTGHNHFLAHMEYPTPFRCSMAHGDFCAKSDTDINDKGRLYSRGHFDLVVLNPEFVSSCNYNVRKGQNWKELRDFLSTENIKLKHAAFYVFELMFLRDSFFRDVTSKHGKTTMMTVAKMIKQDWEKAQHALKPMTGGFAFAERAEMLVFTNSLCKPAIDFLKEHIPKEVTITSTCRPEMRRRAECKKGGVDAATDEKPCFQSR